MRSPVGLGHLGAQRAAEPRAGVVLLSSDEVGWGCSALPKVLGKAGLTLSTGVFWRVSAEEVLAGRGPSSGTPLNGHMQGLSRQRDSSVVSTSI